MYSILWLESDKMKSYDEVKQEYAEKARIIWLKRVSNGKVPFSKLEKIIKHLEIAYGELDGIAADEFPGIALLISRQHIFYAKELLKTETNALKRLKSD